MPRLSALAGTMFQLVLLLSLVSLQGVVLAPLAAGAEDLSSEVDWEEVADVDTVRVLSRNADGTWRHTKVWLVVLDGEGYLRTESTTWGDNVEREPRIELRIDGEAYDLLAHFVQDEDLRQSVNATFREKYGFSDRVVSIFRGGGRIIRLHPGVGFEEGS